MTGFTNYGLFEKNIFFNFFITFATVENSKNRNLRMSRVHTEEESMKKTL